MMKVLMKKILFKKRIYTVYTKYIIRSIIPLYYRILYHAKGNKLKKKGNVCSNPQSVYFDRLSSSFSYPTYLAV